MKAVAKAVFALDGSDDDRDSSNNGVVVDGDLFVVEKAVGVITIIIIVISIAVVVGTSNVFIGDILVCLMQLIIMANYNTRTHHFSPH